MKRAGALLLWLGLVGCTGTTVLGSASDGGAGHGGDGGATAGAAGTGRGGTGGAAGAGGKAGASATAGNGGIGGISGTGGIATAGGAGSGNDAATDAEPHDAPAADAPAPDGPIDGAIDALRSDASDGPFIPPKPPGVTSWEPTPADPNAKISAVAVTNDLNTVIVGMTNGDIYVRDNGASVPTWQTQRSHMAMLPTSMAVTALAIDDRQAPPMFYAGYMGAGTSKFWSSPGGNGWTDRGGVADDVQALSIDPFGANEIVLVTAGGVSVSLDGGGSWNAGLIADAPSFGLQTNERPTAFATITISGMRTVWMGTSIGRVAWTANPPSSASYTWTQVQQQQMPAIPVTGVTIDHTTTGLRSVWVTFQGLDGNDIWYYAPDMGIDWTNRHVAPLPTSAAATGAAVLRVGAVPSPELEYVATIGPNGLATFWTIYGGATWGVN